MYIIYKLDKKVVEFFDRVKVDQIRGLLRLQQIFYRRHISSFSTFAIPYQQVELTYTSFTVSGTDVRVDFEADVTFRFQGTVPSQDDVQQALVSIDKKEYIDNFVKEAPPKEVFEL